MLDQSLTARTRATRKSAQARLLAWLFAHLLILYCSHMLRDRSTYGSEKAPTLPQGYQEAAIVPVVTAPARS